MLLVDAAFDIIIIVGEELVGTPTELLVLASEGLLPAWDGEMT